MPGSIDLAGVGAKAVGDDPESAIPPMSDHQAEVERLRERSPKRWMASATATRSERTVIERGIGPGGFCSRQRWAGGTAGRVERKRAWRPALDEDGLEGGEVSAGGERSDRATAAGRRYRVVGIGKRNAAARGWMAVTEARAVRASVAARNRTLGTIQKRGRPRRCRGRPLLGGRERRRLLPVARAREGGRSRRAADQAASPKTMSGRLVQTAERSSPLAK